MAFSPVLGAYAFGNKQWSALALMRFAKPEMIDRKPDPAVLQKYAAVSYETAAALLEIGARQLRKLIAAGKLERVGAGHRRRVKSESVAVYGGYEINPELNGTKRN